MKERFTSEEWTRLERLPVLVFQFVAIADQKIEPHEVQAFLNELQDALQYRDPLIRELFADMNQVPVFQAAWDGMSSIANTSGDAIAAEIAATKSLLQSKLSADEYQRFFFVLLGVGVTISNAQGEAKKKGIFRRKKADTAVDIREMQSLSVLADQFGVDLAAGQRALTQMV